MKAFVSSGVLIIGTILLTTAIYMLLNYNNLEVSNAEDENIMLTEAYGQNILSILDTAIQEQIIDKTKHFCCVLQSGTGSGTFLNSNISDVILNISNGLSSPPFNVSMGTATGWAADLNCNSATYSNVNTTINMTVKGPNTAKRYYFNLTNAVAITALSNPTSVNVKVNSSVAQTKRYNFTITC